MYEAFAVADTNTVVSAFLAPHSIPALAVAHLGASHRLLGSEETVAELYDVVLRKKFAIIPLPQRRRLLDEFVSTLYIIAITTNVVACRHSKDDKFLSLAVSGQAQIILTGDNDLLVLHPFRGVNIWKPATYLARSNS